MAYGNANLDSDYQTWASADIPMLIGRNWLRLSTSAARWTAGAWAADQSDSDGPATYGYDENDHLQTFPSSTSYYCFVINFGAAAADVDSVVILNHNLNTCGASGVYIEFDPDQDGLFDGVISESASDTTLATDGRLVFLDLDHGGAGQPQLYSDVRYMRIRVDSPSTVPKFGEVVIGQRTQLNHHPTLPYNDRQFISSINRYQSDSGVIRDYVFYTGRRKLAATYTAHEDARITDIDDFWKTETEYGTLPFIWIDEPTTTPEDAYWMRFEEPEYMHPILGYSEREWTFAAIEQGPNFLSEE